MKLNQSIENLMSHFDGGYPTIVLQWRTVKKEAIHFRVVIGYNRQSERIIVHDPEIGPYLELSHKMFYHLWKDFKNNCLLIKTAAA